MFWRILLTLFVGLFVAAETPTFPSFTATEPTLELAQQKKLLEWNLLRNEVALNSEGNKRIVGKIEQLKKRDYRIFLEQTMVSPKKDIKLRLSQESVNDRRKHL